MAPTAIEKTIKKRENYEIYITWYEKKISNHTTAPLSYGQAEQYLEEAEAKKVQLHANFEDVLSQVSDDDLDDESNKSLALLDRVVAVIATLQQIKSSLTPVMSRGSTSATPMDVRLPRLDVPTFSGRYEDWTSYHDLFSALVHSKTQLTGAQKLQYLKSSLTGEASNLLRSIPVTDANYLQAWDLLKKRYDNQRQIVHNHLKRLIYQPKLASENASDLRQLVDTSVESTRALSTLKRPVEQWDDLLIFLLSEKLDSATREKWESHQKSSDLPLFSDFTSFLENRCRVLEALVPENKPKRSHQKENQRMGTHLMMSSACIVCTENHQIFHCKKFLNMPQHERYQILKKNNLCLNCLRRGHGAAACKSTGTCRNCKGKHHTLLHKEPQSQAAPQPPRDNNQTQTTSSTSDPPPIKIGTTSVNGYVLLSTAIILIKDSFGCNQKCRALLDSGSQASLITEDCAQRLRLNRKVLKIPIGGVGGGEVCKTSGLVQLHISSEIQPSFTTTLESYILPRITTLQPHQPVMEGNWTSLRNLTLADPMYGQPGEIDVLLGADILAELFLSERVMGKDGSPYAQSTVFGWVLSGRVCKPPTHISHLVTSHVSVINEDDQLRKFWEIEEIAIKPPLTADEEQCEEIFRSTTTVDSTTGKYVTDLPFRAAPPNIGSTTSLALRRFNQLEKRLQGNPNQKQKYIEFMDEYLSLGHMEEIPASEIEQESVCYIPHHCVIKESSTTTQLRVVFDASAQSTNGNSLNSNLLVGPRVQDDLIAILSRFRCHEVAFTADVAKMYRQILVKPEHCNYQRILWRNRECDPIIHYRLLTVTYGTASAPYIATKCLQTLGSEYENINPIISHVLQNDFYVDDLLSGADSTEAAVRLQQSLIQALSTRGFHLRKWTSNNSEVLSSLPDDMRETKLPLSLELDDTIKALGIVWHPAHDHFSFKVSLPSAPETTTKRSLLSDTAKLFDPLGWLSPSILLAKIMFQKLWVLGLKWDDPLPNEIHQEWKLLRDDFKTFEKIQIQRKIGKIGQHTQFHGFSDASEKAYGACVYVRQQINNETKIHLIASKTRVAPVKQVSIPRLELRCIIIN